MKRLLYYGLTTWLLLWLQVVSHHFLGGTLFAAQWIFLATLYFGLTRGPWVAQWLGFVWGLLLDASSLGALGTHSMLFAVAGYSAGIFRRQLDASKLWTQTIFSWMASVAYFVGYFLMRRFLTAGEESVRWMFLSVPILNALLAPLMFQALGFWAQAWDMAPPERDL